MYFLLYAQCTRGVPLLKPLGLNVNISRLIHENCLFFRDIPFYFTISITIYIYIQLYIKNYRYSEIKRNISGKF